MPTLSDYIAWRGDLTFTEAPFCEVDNLIFCLLSYVDLDGIVPAHPHLGGISLRAAAAEYFLTHSDSVARPLGLIIPRDILTIFRGMAHAPRSRDLILTGYVNRVSQRRECQFSALTILLPEECAFVAFRGTDDSIVGWKEDLNLSILEEIPAQRMATEYLNGLDLPPDTAILVGGHSKGGNLAVWGAVHAEESIRRRLRTVYSNDGPGFSEGTTRSEAYRSLRARIHLFLPEDSLVGLLLEQEENFQVVKSSRRGLFQHDGVSWEVKGSSFCYAEALSPAGLRHQSLLRDRIYALPASQRRDCIRILFSLLEATGADTLTDLHDAKFHSAMALLKAYHVLSAADREILHTLCDGLFTSPAKRRSIKSPKHQKGKVCVEFPRRKSHH